MKTLILAIAMACSAGCATTLGALPPDPAIAGTPLDAQGSADQSPAAVTAPDMSPRIVIPATGGAPIIGIPLGGGIFLPTTGGPPVIGIPTGP